MELVTRCEVCRGLIDEEDLFCANCGKSVDIATNRTASSDSSLFTHQFQCDGCGASMSYDASAENLRCPYCASERLKEQQDSLGIVPTRLIPFRIDQGNAQQLVRTWLGRGFWRPTDLSSSAQISKIVAVYVPYWVFSASTHTYWTADSGDTPFGARADWYPVSGDHHDQYQGIIVGASSSLTPEETNQLCPFELGQAVPADLSVLENANVERFTVPRKYARPLAREGLEQHEQQAISRNYLPGRHRNLKANVLIENLQSEPIVLPVWIMAYRYRDQLFRILVNGQSGKIHGQAPFSWTKGIVVGIIIFVVALIAFGTLVASR